MRFFRPRIKFPKFSTKRQFAKSAGAATLLMMIVALTASINFKSSAALLTSPNWDAAKNTWTTSGDWKNCNGSIDNDSAHHSFNLSDGDPAHHMGMVCDGTREAWSLATPKPTDTTTAQTTTTNVNTSNTSPVQTSFTQISAPVITSTANKTSPAPAPIYTPPSTSSSNPFAGAKLYVNPYNEPSNYVRSHAGTYEGKMMDKIARQPEVTWLGGWNWNLKADVSNAMKNAQDQGALPVFVVYNIPNRDCGGYSAGGVTDSWSYRNWISQMADTIGSQKAVVILEPDALTLTDCLSSWQKSERYGMVKDAIAKFKSKNNTSVYVDAGHPNWLSASDMAERLKQAGIEAADGFALNIANFYTNDQNAEYGKQISEKIGGKHFIVDTGRNGSGPTWDSQWCNPPDRSLGNPPTTNTGKVLIDAYLWVKGPGGSDGNCNGGPSAGTFWPEYALGLAQRTGW